MRLFRFLSIFAAFAALGNPALADADRVLVQSTTSTENSGLYAYLLPLFQAETGLRVDVVAVGTGQAIKTRVTAMRMCCWSTRNQPKKNSSPMAWASNALT